MWPDGRGLKESNGFAHGRIFSELTKWKTAEWNKVTAQERLSGEAAMAGNPGPGGLLWLAGCLSHANEWEGSKRGLPWWWAMMARDRRHMAKEEMQSYVSAQWFINNSTRSAKADWRHAGCYVIRPQRGMRALSILMRRAWRACSVAEASGSVALETQFVQLKNNL